MDDDSEDTRARRDLAKEQTGMEIRLRSSRASVHQLTHSQRRLSYSAGRMPLPLLRGSSTGKDMQGNSWDEYGDSSSAASASASAEEGGKGTHSMSERPSKWGPWLTGECEQ